MKILCKKCNTSKERLVKTRRKNGNYTYIDEKGRRWGSGIECPDCFIQKKSKKRAKKRAEARGPMKCVICSKDITFTGRLKKTCSKECSIENQRRSVNAKNLAAYYRRLEKKKKKKEEMLDLIENALSSDTQ